MQLKPVAVKDLRIDGTQMRVALDQGVVAEYAEAMKDGAAFPPGVAYFDGSNHWLADGIHRLFAHRKIGAKTMEVELHQGTQRDAILYAVGANAKHGLRFTREDKRRAVLTLLEDDEWSQWSDREIARRCGVSPDTVGRLRPRGSEDAGERKARRGDSEYKIDTGSIGKNAASDKPRGDGQARQEGPAENPPTLATPRDTSAENPGPVKSVKTDESAQKIGSSVRIGQIEQDEDDDFNALAELEIAHREIEQLTERIKALSASDVAAELDKQIRARQGIEARLAQTMDRCVKLDADLKSYGRLFSQLRKITGMDSHAAIIDAVRRLVQQQEAA